MQIANPSLDQAITVDEIVKNIGDSTYHLVPGADKQLEQYYEQTHRYGELSDLAREKFQRADILRDHGFNEQLHTCLTSVLPKDLCRMFVEQGKQSKEAFYQPEFINSLLSMLLSPELDSLLCTYFNSEYALLWYQFVDTTADQAPGADSLWHCEAGPKTQLKLQIYLNANDTHGGNIEFLSRQATEQLKQCGYIFGSESHRQQDLSDLAGANGISLDHDSHDSIGQGDALLYNPNQLACRHVPPRSGTCHVLQLCFIASPVHWQQTKNDILYSKTYCTGFEGQARKVLDHLNKKPGELDDALIVPNSGKMSPEWLHTLLHNIFTDSEFAQGQFEQIIKLDPWLETFTGLDYLLVHLKQAIRDSIDWQGKLAERYITRLAQVAAFERRLKDGKSRYSAEGKPDVSAMMWPTPTHPHIPLSKYNLLPYVKKYPLVDKSTAIGTAGSCFSQEMARVLQKRGYNYIITERNDDPHSGIVIDNYNPGDDYAIYCASYGLYFNSPSFKQMAERAFGVKPTQKMVFQQPDGSWVDPYRENIMFMTHEAFVNDYDKHLEATRKCLEQVEVMVITLGLNECWQLQDGSFLSRNPRELMYPLVKHRTLSVAENVESIQTFFDIVKAHNPKFKLVIGLSPIPFLGTGRSDEHHIITANGHSKAVLRVACEELVNNNEDMYYLPSWELVIDCIKAPWDPDERHVNIASIEKIISLFEEIFIRD